jgi:hypothetical protein
VQFKKVLILTKDFLNFQISQILVKILEKKDHRIFFDWKIWRQNFNPISRNIDFQIKMLGKFLLQF